jgi:hypothetical protein
MIRPPIILRSSTLRQFAASYILEAAPDNCVVLFKEGKRTLEQNAKLHAAIQDVAEQLTWHGRKLPLWKWKRLFVAALAEVEVVPGIEPGQFVPMWKSTAELSVSEASDMIELVHAFGAERGVVFREPVATMERA